MFYDGYTHSLAAIMRLNLIELLAANPIAHTTRVECATVRQDCLELVVRGYAWWNAAVAGAHEQQITLGFEGVSDGELPVCLANQFWDEALEDFSVRPLTNVGWAQPGSKSIYCSGPLADPATIYARLQTYLGEVGAFKGPGDFLNNGALLSSFAKVTSGQSYLIARGPDVVCHLLSEELDRQAVPHNVLTHHCPVENRLWVSLNGSSFLCATAWAEFAS